LQIWGLSKCMFQIIIDSNQWTNNHESVTGLRCTIWTVPIIDEAGIIILWLYSMGPGGAIAKFIIEGGGSEIGSSAPSSSATGGSPEAETIWGEPRPR